MKLSYEEIWRFHFFVIYLHKKKNISMQSLKQFDKGYTSVEDDKYFDFDDPNWHCWLRSEGFKHITDRTEDSYGFTNHYPEKRYNSFLRNNYWYWSKLMGCYIFHIYVFRNCIIIDKDWDCGGNAGGRCFDITLFTMKEIWDEIIEYIKANND